MKDLYLLVEAEVKIVKVVGADRNLLSIRKLSERTGLTYAHISKVIKFLVKKGILDYSNGKNKRCKSIYLTEKGKLLYQELLKLDKIMGRSFK